MTRFIKLARQNHLLEKFRSDTSSSDDKLISQVFTAWRTLLRNDLAAALLENERLSSADTYKEVDIKFAHISELVERSDQQRLEAGVFEKR
ncbi:hypothetical protein EV361DRAFT_389519 [Lentinula raphanica]|nr:hypothetical protein EV361DRAFT_389519 [Lentinula raphanica]